MEEEWKEEGGWERRRLLQEISTTLEMEIKDNDIDLQTALLWKGWEWDTSTMPYIFK